MKNNEFITGYGLFTSIVVTVIGVGAFSYPGELARIVGTDGWIVTILSGIICYLLFYFMYRVVKANGYIEFYDMLTTNLGRIFAVLAALVFLAYSIIGASFSMRIFIEVIKMYLLERTPTEFLIVITILTASYLIRGKFNSLIKFNEIAFWIMFVPIVIVLLFTLRKTDFTNILPAFNNSPINYFRAIRTTIFSFGGFEIAYIIMPRIKNKNIICKYIVSSMVFITVFYTLLVVFTLATLSKYQSVMLLWPTITMIKSISIPGAFVERWEGVVMTLWIMFFFATFINVFYFSADIIKNVFNFKDIRFSIVLIMPFIYIISMYPKNIAEVYDMAGKSIPVLELFTLVVFPVIIWITSFIRGKGGERSS